MTTSAPSTARGNYHHGDLRQALIAAGVELARTGGPDAVVLREATRRVGVSPNAAYRHFADHDALLAGVCDAAQALVAQQIDAEFERVLPGSPDEVARGHLRAVGTAYVRFALDEPGLFRTAFFVPLDLSQSGSPARAGRTGRTPFELLGAALDELVEAGEMPPERRPGAEFLAWSAVHGLALLLIAGPLRAVPRPEAERLIARTVDTTIAGLTAP